MGTTLPPLDPTVHDAPTAKVRYADIRRRRRLPRAGIHQARGFERTEVKGRIPTTRPAKRGVR